MSDAASDYLVTDPQPPVTSSSSSASSTSSSNSGDQRNNNNNINNNNNKRSMDHVLKKLTSKMHIMDHQSERLVHSIA